MKLYIVRHGETDWNLTGQLQGLLDIPLNEKGRKLAELTGEGMKEIPFTAAFASQLSRAYETAGLILKNNPCYKEHGEEYLNKLTEEQKEALVETHGCKVIRDIRLHEMDTGPWTRCYAHELSGGGLKNVWTDPEGKSLPEGVETFNSMLARAKDFLDDVTRRPELKDRTVLAVTHGGFLRALLHTLSGGPEFGEKLFLNCEAAVAELDENGKVLSLERQLFYDPDLAFKAETY